MSREFPAERYADAGAYLDAYAAEVSRAAAGVDRAAFVRAAKLMEELFERQGTLYVCGNGGSAAVSNHLTCDVLKGVRTDTGITSRVVSLATQVELITAIANDVEYAEIFAYQLRALARPGDALITISSSGDSENVVRALEWSRSERIVTIAMTGFSGGRSAVLADVNLHVPARNYGVVEDVHQSLMHSLAQFLRMSGMPDDLVASRKF